MKNKCSVIGIDLAKNTFSLCGMNERGKVLFAKNMSRSKLLIFLNNTPATHIGLEACGGAHFWAREAIKAGHEVKMMHLAF